MSKRGSDDVPQSPRKSKRQESSSYNSPAAPLPLPEPFQFVGTLQDVNLHPETLIQHFPQLRESQQMHDLYEVVIYNGAQRHPIETYWQLWKDCRLPKDVEFFRDLIDYPLTRSNDGNCAMTPPNRIGRAIVTYHDIKVQAESQSLKALTLEASKKLTDYYLLYNCTRTTRQPLERSIPNHINWFKEALRTIQDSLTQTHELDGIAQGQPSSSGSGPSLTRTAEPAGTGEENTASLSEAVDAMLFKPGMGIPNLKDIALDRTVRNPVVATICMPLILPEEGDHTEVLGILLHGLPGCGKSLIVKSAAKQYGLTLFDVELSSVFSKWQGESEKFIKALFDRAIEKQPSIIFIDEIDSMMKTRSSSDPPSISNVKSMILKLWEDLYDGRHQVVVVGATNNPEVIDTAFLRRFNHRIHVKLPSLEAKSKILKLHLQDIRHTLKPNDIHELVHNKDLMRDMSGDDIKKTIVNAEANLSLERVDCETWERVTENGKEIIMPATPTDGNKDNLIKCSWEDFNEHDKKLLRGRPINKETLFRAFRISRPSNHPNDIVKHMRWARDYGTYE